MLAASPNSSAASTPTSHAVEPTSDIGPKATGPPAYISDTPAARPHSAAIAPAEPKRSDQAGTERAITHVPVAPASSGTINSASHHMLGCCDVGVAASKGNPGSGPCTTLNTVTLVPVPRAKPGPINTAPAHSIAFGTSARSIRNSPVAP